jgi:hypothetical protein
LGIKTSALSIISKLMPCKEVLSLSYPDLVMTVDECKDITGHTAVKLTDSNKWHNRDYQFPETEEVFNAMGANLTCIDIFASRNVEKIVDLNYPQDLCQYDLVLDCGTTEHCFNIGQALINAANAVKVGGYIIHTPPLTMTNHGFYCLQPTLFYDFYTQNGWQIEFITGEYNNQWLEIPAISRVKVQPEVSLLVLAKRTNQNPLIYPMQSKYLINPMLK